MTQTLRQTTHSFGFRIRDAFSASAWPHKNKPRRCSLRLIGVGPIQVSRNRRHLRPSTGAHLLRWHHHCWLLEFSAETQMEEERSHFRHGATLNTEPTGTNTFDVDFNKERWLPWGQNLHHFHWNWWPPRLSLHQIRVSWVFSSEHKNTVAESVIKYWFHISFISISRSFRSIWFPLTVAARRSLKPS